MKKRYAVSMSFMFLIFWCFFPSGNRLQTEFQPMLNRVTLERKTTEVTETRRDKKISIASDSIPSAFKKTHEYISKALISGPERSDLEKYLSDEKLIGYAVELLLDNSNTAKTRKAETGRMDAIDFLEKALMWDRNPKHDSVLQALRTVLMSADDVLSTNSKIDQELRKSKVGDLVEIYSVLYREEPTMAQDLYDSAPDYVRRVYDFGISIVEKKYSKDKKDGKV